MQLDRVKASISLLIEAKQEALDKLEARPDWINPHDFRSGHWVGKRNGMEEELASLKYVMWWLEQIT